ncbi:VWA domain-containing protein [Chloroflexota bacterium]
MFDNKDAYWWEGGKKTESGQEFMPRNLDTQLDKLTRRSAGRRSSTRTERKRGRYVQARPYREGETRTDLAFDATLRAAAPHQKERSEADTGMAYNIHRQDLQRKIRVRKAANLIMFAVDASWSMAVAERMQATKGAIMSLLTDAYQRRDRVGLVVFQKNRATLILKPTNSVTLAKKALADIPVGGKTPLSAGLSLAHDIISQETVLHPDVMPLMILLTDGAGNVSMTDLPPQEEAHLAANKFAQDHIRTVTINMEHAAFDQGLAQQIADAMQGPCYALAELKADQLYQTVRQELDS